MGEPRNLTVLVYSGDQDNIKMDIRVTECKDVD